MDSWKLIHLCHQTSTVHKMYIFILSKLINKVEIIDDASKYYAWWQKYSLHRGWLYSFCTCGVSLKWICDAITWFPYRWIVYRNEDSNLQTKLWRINRPFLSDMWMCHALKVTSTWREEMPTFWNNWCFVFNVKPES